MKKIYNLSAAIIIATATVTSLAGCAGDRYHQSTGEHIDDASTTSRVKDSLSNDNMYKYLDVNVTTFKGTVQLSGFVDNSDQKTRAGTLAKNTAGVKEVVNNITIKG